MRIIGGSAKRTRLLSLPAAALRPMLGRVKESLFNILRDVVPENRVLDLFSGSGSLGLEALSRGARSCVFVEKDRRLAKLAMENAQRCNLAERCELVQADVLELSRRRPSAADFRAGLVFVDPPYVLVDDPNRRAVLFGVLEDLAGAWIGPGAVVVLHHRPMPHAIWPADRLREWDKRVYGQSQLTFFELPAEAGDG